MTINAYNYTGDNRVVNKNLGTKTTYNCEYARDTNLVNPYILLTTNDKLVYQTFNYVVVNENSIDREFSRRKRGYHVNWSESYNDSRGVWYIKLTLDALYTYSDEILNSTQVINRNENDFNLYFNDNIFNKKAYPLTQCVGGFSGFKDTYTYIVNTVAKGGTENG